MIRSQIECQSLNHIDFIITLYIAYKLFNEYNQTPPTPYYLKLKIVLSQRLSFVMRTKCKKESLVRVLQHMFR